MNVLLSINPKYVDAIVKGIKRFELRKTIFKKPKVEKVYIYSTSPVKRIVGSFEIENILEDCPKKLWNIVEKESGISREEYDKYYRESKKGYAIKIKNFEQFSEPIDPVKVINNFTPPQSFCYFNLPISY